jgi:hypothetical protein
MILSHLVVEEAMVPNQNAHLQIPNPYYDSPYFRMHARRCCGHFEQLVINLKLKIKVLVSEVDPIQERNPMA